MDALCVWMLYTKREHVERVPFSLGSGRHSTCMEYTRTHAKTCPAQAFRASKASCAQASHGYWRGREGEGGREGERERARASEKESATIPQTYLAESVYEVVLQKLIPAQIVNSFFI